MAASNVTNFIHRALIIVSAAPAFLRMAMESTYGYGILGKRETRETTTTAAAAPHGRSRARASAGLDPRDRAGFTNHDGRRN